MEEDNILVNHFTIVVHSIIIIIVTDFNLLAIKQPECFKVLDHWVELPIIIKAYLSLKLSIVSELKVELFDAKWFIPSFLKTLTKFLLVNQI